MLKRMVNKIFRPLNLKIEKRNPYSNISVVGGTQDLAEYSSRLYWESKQLNSFIESLEFETSLEIGAGYGRLTPFILEKGEEHHAVEPVDSRIQKVKKLYPNVKCYNSTIEKAELKSNYFDLIVSWTVLQHLPINQVKPIIEKLKKISRGYILLTELTERKASNAYPRSDMPRKSCTTLRANFD